MGYMMLMFTCIACGGTDTGNPNKIPSLRVSIASKGPKKGKFQLNSGGKREPLCRMCVKIVNEKRISAGKEPFSIHPEAYEPMEE